MGGDIFGNLLNLFYQALVNRWIPLIVPLGLAVGLITWWLGHEHGNTKLPKVIIGAALLLGLGSIIAWIAGPVGGGGVIV